MSDLWDGLFESTSLNTDPNKPAAPAPKPVPVAPAAQTAKPAKEPTTKRTRKPKPAPATDAPAEPAVDEGIFFGADTADEVGTAGATAQAQEKIEPTVEGQDEDDFDDLFGGDDLPTPEPVATPAPAPVVPTPEPKADSPKAKRKAGRPEGTKKKTVTAEEYVAKMDAAERGEPVAEKTFPNDAKPDDRSAAEETLEAVPKEIEILVRAIVRIGLEELGSFFSRTRQG